MTDLVFRPARHDEHAALCKLAKTSKYTKDFSNAVMFSSEAAYKKGWIRVVADGLGKPLGLTCRRDKRDGTTVLYFVVVSPEARKSGLGWALIDDMMEVARQGQPRTLTLNVMKDNDAVAFYKKHLFATVGDSLGGEAWAMQRVFR